MEDCCPLCCLDLDETDKDFFPCKCGYQVCLFCYHHVKDDLNGLCPACRTPYDEANITFASRDVRGESGNKVSAIAIGR